MLTTDAARFLFTFDGTKLIVYLAALGGVTSASSYIMIIYTIWSS